MNVEALNLLPPARHATLRLRHRIHVWTLAIAGYGVVTLGACLTLAAGEPVVDRGEAKELTALTRETDGFREETKRHQTDITEENRKKQASDLVADHPDWSILLDLLADKRGEDAVVEGIEVVPYEAKQVNSDQEDRQRAKVKASVSKPDRANMFDVRLTGFARTQTAVTEFADRLQSSGVFDSVTLTRSSARAVGESNAIEFNIQCRLGMAAPAAKEPRP